ncbi:MAG: hypothetical protein PVF15_03010 [Candidatus Bathyarchaeota archaeon]
MSQEQLLQEDEKVEESRKKRSVASEVKERTPEGLLEVLDDIREQTGQISELTTEEDLLVKEFLASILGIMKPLVRTLPISTTILPKEWGEISQANLDLTGQLLVLYPNGRMRTINLAERKHRELLLNITYDLMPKLKKLVTSHRQNIEKRVKVMSSITKELQKTAKAFSPDNESS